VLLMMKRVQGTTQVGCSTFTSSLASLVDGLFWFRMYPSLLAYYSPMR